MVEEYDAIIAGAGFGGVTMLHRLRKMGLTNSKIFEKGAGAAGIWYWNCYPGARVDSDTPIYQLFDEEVWKDFAFKERYPGWQELRRYFQYIDEKYQFSKDVKYSCAVVHARFDEDKGKWHVKGADGTEAYAKWFIPAIGFAAKKFIPAYKNIDKFKGPIHHTAEWPQQGVDLKGKRVAVIGTGASGVQTIQETGPMVSHLTVYQRTPNYACPMNQYPMSEQEINRRKDDGEFNETFKKVYTTFAGFAYDFQDINTFDHTPEERQKFYEDLLIKKGGFRYWLNTYKDMLFDEKANREAYNFWRDYTRSRINDPKKKDILAPMEPPYAWGTKRPSLEQNYYEVFNLPHVDLIDCKADPIVEFTETGITTADGGHKEFDVVALATGFDSVTGSLAQLDIRGNDGTNIEQHWADGLRTQLGVALEGYPNMFFLYGPQAPTAFSNGPSCVQVQADWLEKVIKDCEAKGIKRIEATKEGEDRWTEETHKYWNASLFPQTKSWYSGANIPGKRVEPLNFAGGIPTYIKELDDSIANNYQGWKTS